MEEARKLNMQMKDAENSSGLMVNPLQNMNLMDDFLFDVATVDLETCKIIIELSLGITIKKIRWKEGQKVVHNMPGKRGIRMDFYVECVNVLYELVGVERGNFQRGFARFVSRFAHFVFAVVGVGNKVSHVGDVHYRFDLVAVVFQNTAQFVHKHVGT